MRVAEGVVYKELTISRKIPILPSIYMTTGYLKQVRPSKPIPSAPGPGGARVLDAPPRQIPRMGRYGSEVPKGPRREAPSAKILGSRARGPRGRVSSSGVKILPEQDLG